MEFKECPKCNAIILDGEMLCFSCGFKLISIDSEIGLLSKSATELKKNNKLNDAIDILVKVISLMKQSELQYGVDKFVRLPLYLQQANRFDESISVFNELTEYFSELVLKGGTFTDNKTKRFRHSYLESLYKSKALACKRAKRYDLENDSVEQSNYHKEQSEKYRALSDAEDSERSRIYRENRLKRNIQNLS